LNILKNNNMDIKDLIKRGSKTAKGGFRNEKDVIFVLITGKKTR